MKSRKKARKIAARRPRKNRIPAEGPSKWLQRQIVLAVQSAGEGIYGLDGEGRATFINPAGARMLGWVVEDLVGQPMHVIMHHSRTDGSPYPKEECPIYAAFLDGKTHAVQDEVFWRKNGTSFAVQYTSTPVRDEQGQPIGAVVSFRDVTEQKQAEAVLHQSQEKFFKAFRANPDAMAISTLKEGRYLEVNDSFLRLSGFSREEVIGRTALELGLWPAPTDRQRLVRRLSEKGRVENLELQFRVKSGETRQALLSAELVDLGGATCMLANVRDVTDWKQSQAERERLRREAQSAEQRFHELVQSIDAIVWEADPETFRVTFLSQQVEKILGYSSEQAVADPGFWSRRIHPEDHERVLQCFRHAVQEGGNHEVEFRMLAANGRSVWLRNLIRVTHESVSSLRQLRGLMVNTTAQKRAEIERQVMYEIIHAVTVTENLDELLGRIHESLGRVVYAENCFVALYEKHSGYFHFPFFADKYDSTPPPQKLEKSCTAYVYRTGHPHLITEEDFQKLVEQGEVELIGTASPVWLGVPLRTPLETIGVLALQHYEDPSVYTERDLEFLSSVAGQIAVAIERKRAEQTLRESEAKFRTLAESTTALIGIYQGTQFRYLNLAAVLLTGYTHEELLTMNVLELVDPDFRTLTQERMRLREIGKPLQGRFEIKIRTKHGQERWIDLAAGNIEFEGKPAVLATGYDITERKRADEQLRLLAAAVEGASDFISISNPKGEIAFVNRAILEAYGYSREELMGRHFNIFRSPHNPPNLDKEIWEATQRGNWQGEVLNRRKDGSDFPIWLVTTPIRDPEGAVIGYLGSARDITEHRRLEDQLRQAQKMEAVGRLAGGIAHDFNNLLTIIQGRSELILDAASSQDAQRRNVEEIRKAAERAASLTHQLLAFGRKQMLEPKTLDLNTVVASLEPMLRRLIGENIELVTRLGSHLGKVKADPSQLEQVIMNLALNARDAMLQGGRLTIETVNAELDELFTRQHRGAQPGLHVLLAVSDTGTGMDAETQAHVFEPFFTTKEKGTGLGLATVYGIVKQSEGYITVYSEPGLGSTFKVYLPRVDTPTETAAPLSTAAGQPQGNETILLVEDEDGVREVTRSFLEMCGYTVLEAPNGDDAIELAQKHTGPVHLLLTDVVMPGISGRALAGRLTSLRPETKVLFMSGYTDDAMLQQGVIAAEEAFLRKPFTRAALAQKVREVLGGQPK